MSGVRLERETEPKVGEGIQEEGWPGGGAKRAERDSFTRKPWPGSGSEEQ